ncbi:MAG TPA: hypothetical protein V6C91_06640 [Coleofasciculaceae cyanobacterium]
MHDIYQLGDLSSVLITSTFHSYLRKSRETSWSEMLCLLLNGVRQLAQTSVMLFGLVAVKIKKRAT